MEPGYVIAFTTGFLGGFGHCMGMCGPIVASYALSDSATTRMTGKFLTHLLYNTGRITTYMFVGALMGLTGSFVNVAGGMSGIQNAVGVIAGLVMVLMGLNISGLAGNMKWLEGHNAFIMRAGKAILQERSLWRFYPLGALFGLLPCGLSYTAFMAAAGTGGPLSGMFLMLLFGMGTLPALLLFGIAASYISARLRGMLYKSAGVIIIATGIYYLMKGIRMYGQV